MQFQTDTPLSEPEDDLFGRWPFSQRIASVIEQTRPSRSRVIGLYGAWGEGKTTVINFTEQALEKNKGIVTVRFNPWQYGTESQLVRQFFDVLADAVGKSLSGRFGDVKEWIKKYGDRISLLSTVASASLGIPLPDPEKLNSLISAPDLEKLRDKVNKALTDSDKHFVIFIDDIDRLDKREVQAVFRLVKLTADFPHTTYVLAFDPEVVSQALGERYASSSTARYGHDFLEKIIEVPLQLPPANERALLSMCSDGVRAALELSRLELTDPQRQDLAWHFKVGIMPALRTPRLARRLSNALIFALPLLKGEVNPVDHALVESMRIVYPKLYKHIKKNRDLYLKAKDTNRSLESGRNDEDKARKELAKARDHLGRLERSAADQLIAFLFPGTASIGIPMFGSERKQGIASDDYFDRYFQYAVVEGDISDLAVRNLIDQAAQNDLDVSKDMLSGLFEGDADKLVRKFSNELDSIPPGSIVPLARAFASQLGKMPDEPVFLSLSAADSTTYLIAELVSRAPENERLELALQLCHDTHPLWRSLRLAWRLTPGEGADYNGPLPASDRQALIGEIVSRMREAALEDSDVLHAGEQRAYADWLYRAWSQIDENEVQDYLRERLSSHPKEATDILVGFTPWAFSNEGHHPTNFEREQYDKLCQLVDPDQLMDALTQTYSEDILSAKYQRGQDRGELSHERRIVSQFSTLHRRAQNENDGDTT